MAVKHGLEDRGSRWTPQPVGLPTLQAHDTRGAVNFAAANPLYDSSSRLVSQSKVCSAASVNISAFTLLSVRDKQMNSHGICWQLERAAELQQLSGSGSRHPLLADYNSDPEISWIRSSLLQRSIGILCLVLVLGFSGMVAYEVLGLNPA